ncbi:hypothetical protein BDV06DRAFT_228959 [Aspergillus oleicola]
MSTKEGAPEKVEIHQIEQPEILKNDELMHNAFDEAGISSDKAFQLNLITCLQFVANIGSWFLTSWFRRRTVFLWGTGTNIMFLLILAYLGVIICFVYTRVQSPISYTIVSETSSVCLRALSTAVGRSAYYITEIPMIYLSSRMLNTTGWNLTAYFFLPELKHRSYREAGILFNRKVPARKFKTTIIGVEEND